MTEVTVSNGKISLGWRKQKHDAYLAEEAPDGTITLTPAERVPARLAETLRSPVTDFARRMPSRTEIQEKVRQMPLREQA